MKICSNVPGHMAKMAPSLIYGKKNIQKPPSSEPRDWWFWNLIYSICSSTTKFVQMMTLGWPWPFLWHGQRSSFLMLLHGWQLIQHIVMYFQACSNSAYPMHSGERYRTNGFPVLFWNRKIPTVVMAIGRGCPTIVIVTICRHTF